MTKNSIPNDALCARCLGLCCRYITIEIDKPRTKREKDDVRWYLLHEGVTLLITPDRWMVKVPARCSALTEENVCGIYPDRPQACREYSTENCDYYTEYEGWDTDYIEIETVEAFETYLKSRSRKRSPQKGRAAGSSRSKKSRKS